MPAACEIGADDVGAVATGSGNELFSSARKREAINACGGGARKTALLDRWLVERPGVPLLGSGNNKERQLHQRSGKT